MQPTRELVHAAPKVLLHDHLDGGLRPQTVRDLAAQTGHRLPGSTDLGAWFVEASSAGSLAGYLAPFAHTVPLLQSAASLTRVAREAATDLAADGVVYAEIRWAPELHRSAGLSADQAVAAVAAGLAEAPGTIAVRQLLTAIRGGDHVLDTARLAVAWRDRGVAGFDLAGEEAGHPAVAHADAFAVLREAGVRYTIHAGEGAGPESVRDAVVCGASRLGHGVRVAEDVGDSGPGRLASYVRDLGVSLEICPTSNVQTGAVTSLAAHPGGALDRLGVRITVNTDNRLMSGTSTTSELLVAADTFGWDLADLARVSVIAAEAAFLPYQERLALVAAVRDGWARVIAG